MIYPRGRLQLYERERERGWVRCVALGPSSVVKGKGGERERAMGWGEKWRSLLLISPRLIASRAANDFYFHGRRKRIEQPGANNRLLVLARGMAPSRFRTIVTCADK
jgi:hypothetical protein